MSGATAHIISRRTVAGRRITSNAPASDPNAVPITSIGPSRFSARNNSSRSSATSARAKGPGGFSDRPAQRISTASTRRSVARSGDDLAPTFAIAAKLVQQQHRNPAAAGLFEKQADATGTD